MSSSDKSGIQSGWIRVALIVCLGAMLYGAVAYAIYAGLTRQQLGANDFYSRWMGARALLSGQNPYSAEVTREIQLGMYGRIAQPNEDQVAFAYPLYAALLAAPLTGMPYDAAQALWMAFLVMLVVAGVLALAIANRFPLTPLTLLVLVLGALVFYPSVRGIFLGNFTLVSFGCIALCILATARGHETSAGILLALASVKPQPVVLILPVILFWAWSNGMRRLVISALATLTALVGVSFLLLPTWVGDFWNGLGNYAGYLPIGPPAETLYKLVLPASLAPLLTWVTGASLLTCTAVLVWRNKSQTWFEFQTTLGFAALVTTLTAIRIGSPDQMLLLILWMAWLGGWCAARKWLWVAAALIFLLFAPWYVFFTTLEGNQEGLVVSTILPWVTLAVFAVGSIPLKRRVRNDLMMDT